MKKILLPGIVLILLAFSYFYYTSSAPVTESALISGNSSGAQSGVVVGAEIISLLEKLDRITLDTSLFSEATFQSLKDFTITLRPQEVGRPNPFAPLGANAAAAPARVIPAALAPSSDVSTEEVISEETVTEEDPSSDFDTIPEPDLGQ